MEAIIQDSMEVGDTTLDTISGDIIQDSIIDTDTIDIITGITIVEDMDSTPDSGSRGVFYSNYECRRSQIWGNGYYIYYIL